MPPAQRGPGFPSPRSLPDQLDGAPERASGPDGHGRKGPTLVRRASTAGQREEGCAHRHGDSMASRARSSPVHRPAGARARGPGLTGIGTAGAAGTPLVRKMLHVTLVVCLRGDRGPATWAHKAPSQRPGSTREAGSNRLPPRQRTSTKQWARRPPLPATRTMPATLPWAPASNPPPRARRPARRAHHGGRGTRSRPVRPRAHVAGRGPRGLPVGHPRPLPAPGRGALNPTQAGALARTPHTQRRCAEPRDARSTGDAHHDRSPVIGVVPPREAGPLKRVDEGSLHVAWMQQREVPDQVARLVEAELVVLGCP